MIKYKGCAYRPFADIRQAFIQQELSWLKSYLTMSGRDKAIELFHSDPYVFSKWLNTYVDRLDGLESSDAEALEAILREAEESGDIIDVIDEISDEYLPKFSDSDLEAFLEFGGNWLMDSDPAHAPSFIFMDYVRVVKNQWLIHFTDDPYKILSKGFTYGVEDLSRLGLTTHFTKESKKRGGYNFAFPADMRRPEYGLKYGEGVVMFRASGVEIYHHGDEEYQIIFWGDSAKDFIILEEHDGTWCPDPCSLNHEPPYCNDELAKVVDWIINNFDQYRKILVCR